MLAAGCEAATLAAGCDAAVEGAADGAGVAELPEQADRTMAMVAAATARRRMVELWKLKPFSSFEPALGRRTNVA
jgi:hypothetical protein